MIEHAAPKEDGVVLLRVVRGEAERGIPRQLADEREQFLFPLIGELAWDAALGFTPNEAQKNDPVLLGRGVLEHLKQRAAAVADRDPDRGAACLLLLDNVSEPYLLSAAQLATLPSGLGAGWLRLVATTRLDLRAQKDRLALLAVDALDPDSALTLLRDHQPPRDAQRRLVADLEEGEPQFASDAEESAAREIVRALGGFTLAVAGELRLTVAEVGHEAALRVA